MYRYIHVFTIILEPLHEAEMKSRSFASIIIAPLAPTSLQRPTPRSWVQCLDIGIDNGWIPPLGVPTENDVLHRESRCMATSTPLSPKKRSSSPMCVMFSPGKQRRNTRNSNLFASETHEAKKKEGRGQEARQRLAKATGAPPKRAQAVRHTVY